MPEQAPVVSPPPPIVPAPTPPKEKPAEITLDEFKQKIINRELDAPPPKMETASDILRKRGEKFIDPAAPPEKKDEKPAETPPVEAKVEKPVEEPPAETPKKAPVKRAIKVAKGYEGVDPEKLATAVAKVVMDAKAKEEPAKETVKEPEFNDEEQEQLRVLAQLEEDRPDTYKGITGRAKQFMAAIATVESSFRQTWDAANPAASFDSETQRREAFDTAQVQEVERLRRQHRVEWNDKHFDKAALRLEVKPLIEQNKQLERKVALMEEKEAKEAVEVPAQKLSEASVKDVIGTIMGDGAKAVMNGKGFDAAAAMEADPEAAPILEAAAATAREFADKCFKAFKGIGEAEDFTAIGNTCRSIEKAILSSDNTEDSEGRQFSTKAAYTRMSEEQRKAHWTLDAETAIAHFNGYVIDDAKAKIASERLRGDKIVAKRGGVAVKGTPIDTPPPVKPVSVNVKPTSPSTSITPPAPGPTQIPAANDFWTKHFGGAVPPSAR